MSGLSGPVNKERDHHGCGPEQAVGGNAHRINTLTGDFPIRRRARSREHPWTADPRRNPRNIDSERIASMRRKGDHLLDEPTPP